MKMINNSICALIAALAMGCPGGSGNSSGSSAPQIQTIRGKPISVAYTSNSKSDWPALAGVFDVDGKMLLAAHWGGVNPPTTKAAALIQSEIADGDDDLVELTGKYDADGTFNITSVRANGYKVDF